jgi:hypothetical protein
LANLSFGKSRPYFFGRITWMVYLPFSQADPMADYAPKSGAMEWSKNRGGIIEITRPLNWHGISSRHADERAVIGEFGECFVRELVEGRGHRLHKQERRACNLPDFRVDASETFIEVKAHKTRLPHVWQKAYFSSMVKMGWKIYIAHPSLRIDREKRMVVCKSITWYKFLPEGKVSRIDGCPL